MLLGCRTFNEIAAGAPGLSRALLTRRLRELERARVIEIRPKPGGRGSLYLPTIRGRELWPVLAELQMWAETWMEVTPEHSEPDVILWSWWISGFLRKEVLPDRRMTIRFDVVLGRGRQVRTRCWVLIEHREAEICSFDPGFGDDLVVAVEDSLAFARWHLGRLEWAAALRSRAISVTGDRQLARALPTWNRGPQIHAMMRTQHLRVLGSPPPPPPGARRLATPPATGRRADSIIPGFSGPLVTADDAGYDEARAVWNGAVDRRPRYIARCESTSDVVAALRHGRERGLPITVRAGGNGVAGTAVCDDGLVIDLGSMKRITVDPTLRTATVRAGARWGELDGASQAFGLATPGGLVSHVGLSGHTLGGGIGWLARRYGATIDNLLSAEVVTADGELRMAGTDEHADLFWGLRGGGGGLGVVTSFTYRLHRVAPEVLAGPVLWALDDGPTVLRAYREFVAAAAPVVASTATLRRAPPSHLLTLDLHGRPVCIVTLLALGDPGTAERLLEPMRTFGSPLLDLVKHRPYTGLQSMLDGTVPPGWHYYWKSAGLPRLDDSVIDTMVDHAARSRSLWSFAQLVHLGGAVADAEPGATAYSRRDVAHELLISAAWLPQQPLADAETAWARAFAADLARTGPGCA